MSVLVSNMAIIRADNIYACEDLTNLFSQLNEYETGVFYKSNEH